MSAQPWFKFYPADWRSDSALRMCSPVARYLWLEMLCIMHEANPRGYLTVNGRPVNERQLAIQAGMNLEDVTQSLAELEESGVFSRQPNGTIFSRKMVRETRKSDEQRQRGAGRWSVEKKDEKETGNAKRDAETMPYKKESQKLESQKLEREDSSPYGDSSFQGIVTLENVDPISDAMRLYNEMATRIGLPIAVKLTKPRLAALKLRLKEVGPQGWAVAISTVEGNPFFHGENDRGWRADLDFLLQPSKLTKVIEGGYERARNGTAAYHTGADLERRLAKFEPMAAGAQEALARRRGRDFFGKTDLS